MKFFVKNVGNPYRVLRVMEKARRGEEICIVALGGSITQGFVATNLEKTCYAALCAKWWCDNFPQAKIKFINSGIGATTSHIGLHRLNRDVLDYAPDLVFIEFCVNDSWASEVSPAETYTNLIKQTLTSATKPAVVLVESMRKSGVMAQERFLEAAKPFNVAYISVNDAAKEAFAQDESLKDKFIADAVHPRDEGHAFAAKTICSYFEEIKQRDINNYSDDQYDNILCPIRQYGKTAIYYSGEIEPSEWGCFEIGEASCAKMKTAWKAKTNGKKIVFELKNVKTVDILFERKPQNMGKAILITPDNEKIVLDGDFPNGWGAYAKEKRVFASEDSTDVSFSLTPDLDVGQEFNLIAVMVSK